MLQKRKNGIIIIFGLFAWISVPVSTCNHYASVCHSSEIDVNIF